MYMKVMVGLVLFGFGSDSVVNWIPMREVALLPLDLLLSLGYPNTFIAYNTLILGGVITIVLSSVYTDNTGIHSNVHTYNT